jgi:cytochrome c oxidase cbb3-type subunit III
MMRPIVLSMAPGLFLLACLGCGSRSGAPGGEAAVPRPEDELRFEVLYRQNCSACHGENGSGGPALDLANPNYQALVDDASLRRWITSGMPGTEMTAFGESDGGFLTPKQVDILVGGMRSRWAHADQKVHDMPPYYSSTVGTAERGHQIFQVNCSSCHQQGQQRITDTSYLALVSDQSLRTIIIAGRPDLGQPDSKQVHPGQPLKDQDVSDIVAYLHSLRSDTPGQPYPETSITR